ncbi:TPA: hypothetical protein HA251_04400 [Candidatus Woesearchaeota archaeon]|nr:hypothetical protein [Candidatus Woesearchaeota archaeon]
MSRAGKELSDVLSALGAGPLRRFFHRDGHLMEREQMLARLNALQGNDVAKAIMTRVESYTYPITIDKYRILMEHDGMYRAVRVYGFFTD